MKVSEGDRPSRRRSGRSVHFQPENDERGVPPPHFETAQFYESGSGVIFTPVTGSGVDHHQNQDYAAFAAAASARRSRVFRYVGPGRPDEELNGPSSPAAAMSGRDGKGNPPTLPPPTPPPAPGFTAAAAPGLQLFPPQVSTGPVRISIQSISTSRAMPGMPGVSHVASPVSVMAAASASAVAKGPLTLRTAAGAARQARKAAKQLRRDVKQQQKEVRYALEQAMDDALRGGGGVDGGGGGRIQRRVAFQDEENREGRKDEKEEEEDEEDEEDEDEDEGDDDDDDDDDKCEDYGKGKPETKEQREARGRNSRLRDLERQHEALERELEELWGEPRFWSGQGQWQPPTQSQQAQAHMQAAQVQAQVQADEQLARAMMSRLALDDGDDERLRGMTGRIRLEDDARLAARVQREETKRLARQRLDEVELAWPGVRMAVQLSRDEARLTAEAARMAGKEARRRAAGM